MLSLDQMIFIKIDVVKNSLHELSIIIQVQKMSFKMIFSII
jgi:hypothetical protein